MRPRVSVWRLADFIVVELHRRTKSFGDARAHDTAISRKNLCFVGKPTRRRSLGMRDASPTPVGPRDAERNLELEAPPTLDPDPAPVPHIERLASRSVVDSDGGTWTVQEVRDWGYDRRASSSLVFTGDDAMRRVRNYPPNWIELSDAELIALSFGV